MSTMACEIYNISPIKVRRQITFPSPPFLHVSHILHNHVFTEILCFLLQIFSEAVWFAPLGLIDMFNSGGALHNVSSVADSSATTVHIRCRGPGWFGAYSATRPELCRVDEHEVEFTHAEDGLLTFYLPLSSSQDNLRHIEIVYRAL